MALPVNERRRIMLLTGASRGIGHATVKRFSAAGWRVITCSRHAFPENCPWEMGPEDHLQVDLADAQDTMRAIEEVRGRLDAEGGVLHALVNNAGISPKGPGGERLGALATEFDGWQRVFQVNVFATILLAGACATSSPAPGARSSTSPRSPAPGSTPSRARPTAPPRRPWPA